MTTRAADGRSEDRDTFPKLLAERARTSPDRPAYREKEFGVWQAHRWSHVAAEVRLFAAGLAELGFRRADRRIVAAQPRSALPGATCAAATPGGVAGPGRPH